MGPSSSKAVDRDNGWVTHMSFESAKRSMRLDIQGEDDSWSGTRFEAWEDEHGFRFRKSKIFVAKELEPEVGPIEDMTSEGFERIWASMLETSKDSFSVGIPKYVKRELMLMSLDPSIWTFKALGSGKEVLTFTVAGGPRTPLQEEMCNLLRAKGMVYLG